MRITWVGVPKEYRKGLRAVLKTEHVGEEFMVCSDKGADQKARRYIRDSLWAFNTDFIAAHARGNFDSDAQKALKESQNKLCESANELVFAVIKSFKAFAEDAINCDGRGHFMNTYDGEEREAHVTDSKGDNARWFYIYRTN